MSVGAETGAPQTDPQYNSHVVSRIDAQPGLMRITVQKPAGYADFEPGQYTVLALTAGTARIDGVPVSETGSTKLVKRAYSISCPMLVDGQLATVNSSPVLEFYIALVSRDSDQPPMLTPRLFGLQRGDRLYLGEKVRGQYTLDPVRPDQHVLLLGTGTGEAPHNAMIAELLQRGHQGRIVCCTCVRYEQDLGYLATHRELEQRFPNYTYLSLTTREPWNTDPAHPEYVGKQYLQDLLSDAQQRERIGLTDAKQWHAFLCGNPSMIGLPRRQRDGSLLYPERKGMVEVLQTLGFRLDQPRHPGNLHFEKYW